MNFLECVPPERIEKIDSEKVLPHPEEVLIMADKYKSPELCNYYCSNQCPIGQQYVPEIKMKELPQIILETVASFNKMNKKQERLIEITADGIIDNDELDDFIYIKEELEECWLLELLMKMHIIKENYKRVITNISVR